jgi:hypothetical protein
MCLHKDFTHWSIQIERRILTVDLERVTLANRDGEEKLHGSL